MGKYNEKSDVLEDNLDRTHPQNYYWKAQNACQSTQRVPDKNPIFFLLNTTFRVEIRQKINQTEARESLKFVPADGMFRNFQNNG